LYYNPIVHQPNLRAVKLLGELFNYYLKHPKEIGESSRKRIKKFGLHRAVCDYLAGMTDRYVMLEYQRIFGETFKVV
jgi:dGTPase